MANKNLYYVFRTKSFLILFKRKKIFEKFISISIAFIILYDLMFIFLSVNLPLTFFFFTNEHYDIGIILTKHTNFPSINCSILSNTF